MARGVKGTKVKKSYRDLTPEQKAKRKLYQKSRQQKILQAARAAGVVGAPRPKLSEAERRAHRKTYRKNYQAKMKAGYKAAKAAGLI